MVKKKELPTGIVQRGDSYRWQAMVNGIRLGGTSATVDDAVADRAAAIHRAKTMPFTAEATPAPVRSPKTGTSWTLREALNTTENLPFPEGWLGSKGVKTALLNAEAALEYFGPSTLLENITKPELDVYIATLMKKGNSNATINRKMSALHKMMNVAWRNGGLTAMPHYPKRLTEGKSRDREITPDEEKKLLHFMRHLGQNDHAEAVVCLLDLGCRPSELWAVETRDVDLKTGIIMLWGRDGKGTKNGEHRSVPMTSRVKEIIKARVDAADHPTTLLFPYDNGWMLQAWNRVKLLMGLDSDDKFVPYICRHTCASRLMRGGAPLPVVQKWLGHKNITMTMRYAHLMPTDLLDNVKALEQPAA